MVINIVRDASHLITEHTDVHGRVSVDLPQGAYDVMILAGGYTSTLLRGVGVLDGQRVELIRGLTPGDGRVEEKPAGAIGGICLDRLGHPIMNVIVQAMGDGQNYTVRSDKKGCYVLSGLRPGKYRIVWRTGDRALMTEDINLEHPRELVRKDVALLYA
ncbi:MAG: carboxypeptidase regulatory-like domain-containing protein [Candidatus Eremiobacteraeota bacterium]|nr:carboxypeptidase regulatory-like domain-containing protein [Candidatus Eremiobacteraeota bacterium]